MTAPRRLTRSDTPRKRIKDMRRLQLIEAAIATIATHGMPQTTIAHVSSAAGMSRGIINFYFKSKEVMLRETLAHLLFEEQEAVVATLDRHQDKSSLERLRLVLETLCSPRLYSKKRLSAWCAFAAHGAVHAPTRFVFERAYGAILAMLNSLCHESEIRSEKAAGLLLAVIQGARLSAVTGISQPNIQDLLVLLGGAQPAISPNAPEENPKVVHISEASRSKNRSRQKKPSADASSGVIADLFAF